MPKIKQIWLFIASLFSIWLLTLLQPILLPFLMGIMLAYLFDPVVARFARRGFGRTAAVVVILMAVLLLMIITVLFMLPMLQRQLMMFIDFVPNSIDWLLQQAIPWLKDEFHIDINDFKIAEFKATVLGHWQQAGDIATRLFHVVTYSGMTFVVWIINMLIVPVVLFYFLRDWPYIMARLQMLIPRRFEQEVLQLTQQCDDVLGAFVRGQLIVMCVLAVVYAVGLWLADINMALLIGILSGLLSMVPYLGIVVGLSTAVLAALIQHADVNHVLYVLIVFSLGQVLEGFVLVPNLVGDKIGMHPVAVIFAIMAGGQLFGFVGILLALPTSAVIMVLMRYAHRYYLESAFYLTE